MGLGGAWLVGNQKFDLTPPSFFFGRDVTKDVAAKAKEAEDKSKDAAMVKDASISKPSNKEDPLPSSKA